MLSVWLIRNEKGNDRFIFRISAAKHIFTKRRKNYAKVIGKEITTKREDRTVIL